MKIAIISDLHLGFRQYGSLEREKDFYNQFYKVCREINSHDPDIVIIAGDLFDKANPSPAAINAYREGLEKLYVDIICTIKGNHTMILRDDHFSIDEYFGKENSEGYYYLDDMYMSTKYHGFSSSYDSEYKKYYEKLPNVQIDGITYRNNSDINEFLEKQKEFAELETEEGTYRILVVHQSFKEFCGFLGEELSITDIITEPYDVIICGHIHSRFDTVLSGGTKFIQPGSIERMNTTEALDEQKNGKGFYLLNTENNSLEFFNVECERKFFLGEINIETKEDFQKHLDEVDKQIKKEKVHPIISYKYKNIGLNIDDVREKIGLIEENILLNKSTIDDRSQEEITIEILDDEMPTVFEAIKMYGKESGLNEEECKLALDLHKALNNNVESVNGILEKYYDKNKKENHEIELDDTNLEEIIEYFGE